MWFLFYSLSAIVFFFGTTGDSFLKKKDEFESPVEGALDGILVNERQMVTKKKSCPVRPGKQERKEKKLSARSYQRLHTISSSIPLTGTFFLNLGCLSERSGMVDGLKPSLPAVLMKESSSRNEDSNRWEQRNF